MMAESNQWNDVTTFELEKLEVFARQFPADPLDRKAQESLRRSQLSQRLLSICFGEKYWE